MLQMCWMLRDVINEYITIYGTPKLKKDRLTNLDQATVRVIKDFLEKLLMLTKAYELRESTLDLSLPYTDYILSLFKRLKDEYKDDPTFALMFNSGQVKINKYYKLLDKTPVYVAAMVLYPSRKQKWIKKHQKQEQVLEAKDKIRTFWETKYKPLSTALMTLIAA